jgi:hypothetical protein
MEGEGEAPKIHTLKVADDPGEGFQDSLPPWLKGNDLFALKALTPGLLICGPDGGEDGAILRQKRKLVIGGSSKMGKTWTLCDLALAVASGGKWLGKFKCEQGAVLYVNLELDGCTAGRRMEWIATFREVAVDGKLPPEIHENLSNVESAGQVLRPFHHALCGPPEGQGGAWRPQGHHPRPDL